MKQDFADRQEKREAIAKSKRDEVRAYQMELLEKAKEADLKNEIRKK